MYAAGSIPEIPEEPKNPFAQGEAVRTVPFVVVGVLEAVVVLEIRREEKTGCILK